MKQRAGIPSSDPLGKALFPGAASKVDWGLERMSTALSFLASPHRKYRCLHVGGTNGKGSVASTWASVLAEHGDRVGLYTSPHLRSYRERIRVDGRPLPASRLVQTAGELAPLVARLRMSLFEAWTLLALSIFAEEDVDVACIEVGLGGRLDATNVVSPDVVAITNVAIDHQDYLGSTLGAIAREKAGIIKPGVPAVTIESASEVGAELEARAERVGAPLHRVEPARDLLDLRVGLRGARFRFPSAQWGEIEVETPLAGAHQAANTAVALKALELLPQPPERDVVLQGVAAVEWPGRSDMRVVDGVQYVFDVAHNVAGVHALTRMLDDLEVARPLVALLGVLGDKDWARMLPPLLRIADHAVFTVPVSAPRARSWKPRLVAETVGGLAPVEVVEQVVAAAKRAHELAQEDGGTVVVTGSCHTVGDVLAVLGQSLLPAK